MDWTSIGATLAKVGIAGLSTALLGPAGGTVANLICGWLGLDGAAADAPSQVEQAIQDPNILAALKAKYLEHEQIITRLHLEAEAARLRIEAENTISARQKELGLAQTGFGSAWATALVAGVVTVGFFVILWIVLAGKVAADNQAAVLLLGTMATGFGAVVNYYLGSSLGSTEKNRMILNSVPIEKSEGGTRNG